MKFNKKFIREVKDQTNIVELIQEVGKVDLKKEGKIYKGICCFHNETNPSLSVSEYYQNFKCFGCNVHGDCFEFVKLKKGIKFYEAVKFLADRACISPPEKQEPEEIFQYKDENGKVVNEVLRYPNKKFRQRRPVGKGVYIWKVTNLHRKLPYRLPELIVANKDDWVFIVEGEKHVDRLYSLDLVGTCNVGGAQKWTSDLNPHFKDRKVIILPDNDDPGRKHAQQIANNLYPFAKEIRILKLPGLQPKGDIIDWFDKGHTKEKLISLIEQTSTWNPDKNKENEKIPENKDLTHSQILVSLAEEADLFRTYDDKIYAIYKINGHKENWPIRSNSFKQWLSYKFYKLKDKPPSAQAYQDALGIIEAKGLYDSPLLQIFTRIAEIDEKIYLDLANEKWEAIEISKNGWKIISDPPVKFKRTKGMKEIPSPSKKGSIEDLRPFINISSNEDWILFVSWLISTFMPKGPYPILVIQGEQGSAKSFICRLSRSLIDPSLAPLRTLPKEERDLIIAANNSWIIAFDNLSSLSLWQSDALCRISTGGGFSKRQNYTDEEETILNVMRPVILNGIDSVITRNDLADRSIIINLPPIHDEEREPENELMENISKGLPGFIGVTADGYRTHL